MGDFNTDLLVPDSRTRKLLSVVESVNLKFLPLSATHHSSTTDTLIDLILTSDDSLVARHGQHLAPGFSKHDLIFCSYRLRIPKAKPVVLLQRNFSKLDAERLRSDATQIQWSDMQDLPDINDKVAFLCSNVIKLFDTHAPVRPVKLKHRPTPWINETIRKFMVRRDRAFRRYKISRTEENWSACKVARNRCNQMCRNAKRRYIAEQLELSSPAGTWKFLRSLGVGKPPKLDNQIPFDINTLNNHFASSLTLDSHTKNLTLNLIHNMPTPDIDSFIFAPASPEEIRKIILSIKSKAVGHDNIGRIMVTNLLDILLPAITHITNHSLDSGNFPDLWRKAYVIPLPKISNPSSLNHYRPISILPFLSKVLESIVHRQLTAFLCNGGLLNPYQSGFRAGHSTTTALLKVTEDIRSGMENRMITVLVLIDFSNAFNAVDHDLLLAVLVKSQISPAAVSWFSSYLRGRQQAIRSCSVLSDWSDLSAGVPQGGILSPLLFSIFIDLVSSSLLCSYHLYADDLQLYCQVKPEDLVSAINQLNGDLNSILDWSNRFGILVNPVKCQAIIIGSSQLISNHDLNSAPLVFDGCNIPFSSTVKDLGVTIDENLSWVPQVNSVSRRIFASLHSLLPLKNFLPFQTKRSLAMSLLLPILDYADVCYLDLTEALLNKLERLQNTCIRFIFGLRKYDHVSVRLWNDLPESIRKAPSRPLFKSMGTVDMSHEHAGYLLGLGLNGQLKDMPFMHIYEHLVKCQQLTSVGLLLGLAATYRGTMDVQATKMMSIHLEPLLPPTSIELDIHQHLLVAALLGAGLIYQETRHAPLARVLTREIGKPPGPDMEHCTEREGYALAAGLALGFVYVGAGDEEPETSSVNCISGLALGFVYVGAGDEIPSYIPQCLRTYMLGGDPPSKLGYQKDRSKSGDKSCLNLDVSSGGATLALGLIYLGTGSRAVAQWLRPPPTAYLLDAARPHALMCRAIAIGLIMWHEVEPTEEWVESQVPDTIKPYCFVKPTEDNIDYEAMNQAYCNIVAGACFTLGLRYAGSGLEEARDTALHYTNLRAYCNIVAGACFTLGLRYAGSGLEEARDTALHYTNLFLTLAGKSLGELAGRSTLESCLCVCLLAAAMVMSGRGDIAVHSVCRRLRARVPRPAAARAPALEHGPQVMWGHSHTDTRQIP
ncbi:unnamed protein product [Plutella xylostella]|uniref:(diamondback moth) hypothetical protein n=1 Tax=Plutella xylostella TaxID=51655 RepID=A0A8S4G6P5_PLUXY|nr:unnamed protein product [Plutella xylostella]